MGNLNVSFLNMLASYDRIYIAGEAKSHCVLETVTSIMRYFADQPRIIDKFRILRRLHVVGCASDDRLREHWRSKPLTRFAEVGAANGQVERSSALSESG